MARRYESKVQYCRTIAVQKYVWNGRLLSEQREAASPLPVLDLSRLEGPLKKYLFKAKNCPLSSRRGETETGGRALA